MSQPAVDYVVETTAEEASLRFSRAGRKRQDVEMDITPMIDVTFLLLIFFLVASRLSDEGYVELPTAKNGTAVSQETSCVVTVTKGNGEDADFFLGDGADDTTRVISSNPEQLQTEISKYIESSLTVGSKQQVLIKAEIGVRHRDVARVARAAGSATAQVMYVAVLENR